MNIIDEKCYYMQFSGEWITEWVCYDCENGHTRLFENREDGVQYIHEILHARYSHVRIESNGGQFWTIPYTKGDHKVNFSLIEREKPICV